MEYFSTYEDDRLTDLVFDSNLSIREMAMDLGRTELEVTKEIRNLGLSWVRRRKGHISRGQAALTQIMNKLLPGETIETEYHIGERLRLDVYCPRYELAAEYHGRQHFFYTEFFHGDKEGFYASQERDERKQELCKELGISLVIFRYDDTLTEDAVYERLLDCLRNAPTAEREIKQGSFKGQPVYEEYMNRQRAYRKEQYKRMKKYKKERYSG